MMVTFGNLIKVKRLNKDYSLRSLADITGLDHSYIGRLEKGESKPSRETVTKLSTALDIPLDELLIAAGYHPYNQQVGRINRDKDVIKESAAEYPTLKEQIMAQLRLDKDISEEEKGEIVEDVAEYFEYRKAKSRARSVKKP